MSQHYKAPQKKNTKLDSIKVNKQRMNTQPFKMCKYAKQGNKA